jgi:acyl transferase domain-containing protein
MTDDDRLARAHATIRRLRTELAERRASTRMAIVGMALRFPGDIVDAEGYWRALQEGRDVPGPMPEARRGPFAEEWRDLPAHGGFFDDVFGFDARFFGIATSEARAMDPQHRLALEVTWEALEDAGLPPDRLTGVRTGVYLGITGQDYVAWQPEEADAFWGIGNGNCFAAGRIAYMLGLTGPAIAVDTACSSSIVGVHLAGEALANGDCDVAVAGGVNLIMAPRTTKLLQLTGSLSPDGVCRTFDARANGFARAEGCGMVVLKRLPDAVRDGDRIHGVLLGSALNQDGRTAGLTAPNVLAQTRLIEDALAAAELAPDQIGLVEAHGTGTSLGDPIEVEAIAAALGRRNGGRPLPLGSVKANLGHPESAAGVAGLIKALLCLEHRAIPPLVHFQTLNPRIDLEGTAIRVPAGGEPWEPAEDAAHVGVSSFGMIGTNAHAIVGGAPDGGADRAANGPVPGFELAAKSPRALQELAARLAAALPGLDAGDYPAFAYTTTFGRARHRHRAQVTAPDPERAARALEAIAAGAPSPDVTLVEGASGPPPESLASLPRAVVTLPAYPWQRERHAPPEVAA